MGQFDDELDAEDGLTLTPGPELAPQPQAPLPPEMPMAGPQRPAMQPPTAPVPPTHQRGPMQNIVQMALLGLAAGLGPRRANGMPQGMALGHAANERQAQQDFQNQQVAFHDQQAQFQQQQAMAAQEARVQQARDAKLQQNLQIISTQLKSAKTKEEYDSAVDRFGQMMAMTGESRITANWLRGTMPYRAPEAKQIAGDALTAFFKNPLTQQQLKSDPNAVANGSMKVDLNGDGVPELVPIRQVMQVAGMSVLADDKGQPVQLTSGAQGDLKHEAFKQLQAQFLAENHRAPTAKEMVGLIAKAEAVGREPKEPKGPELMQVTDTDPDTGEIVTSLVPKKAGEVSRKPAKEPNQAQFQAGAYAGRMEQSGEILDSLEKTISGMGMLSFGAQERVPSAMQGGNFQSYDQASRNFINAVLRKESGAAISQSEFDNARKQYLPQPGDTPQTLAQKKQNRDYATSTMKQAAGRGYQAPIKPPAKPPATDVAASAREKLKNR